jgi:hypothetical protein
MSSFDEGISKFLMRKNWDSTSASLNGTIDLLTWLSSTE